MTGQKLDDRVADQLARTVIGHVATATGFKQLDPELRARRVIRQDVRAIGRSPQRDDVRVFKQQKLIGNFVALAPLNEVALQRMRFVVRRQTEETCFAYSHAEVGRTLVCPPSIYGRGRLKSAPLPVVLI